MYSIKPGRGPSFGSAIGGIIAAIVGVFWTMGAASAGAPGVFVLFGVIFVFAGLGSAAYGFYNATARNRFSEYDITRDQEESDPFADAIGYTSRPTSPRHPTHSPPPAIDSRDPDAPPRRYEGDYCPFCGAAVQSEFDYCPKCGKDI